MYKHGAQACQEKKKYKNSLSTNSLLLPQHRHCRRLRLEEALVSHLHLGDPSSPKGVGELRSPEKRSERPISGPPCKGMIPRSDSLPSSLGRRTIARAFCASRAPLHKPRPASSSRPPKLSLGHLGPGKENPRPRTSYTTRHRRPGKEHPRPRTSYITRHRPGPAVVRAPLRAWPALSGSPPTEIKKNKLTINNQQITDKLIIKME